MTTATDFYQLYDDTPSTKKTLDLLGQSDLDSIHKEVYNKLSEIPDLSNIIKENGCISIRLDKRKNIENLFGLVVDTIYSVLNEFITRPDANIDDIFQSLYLVYRSPEGTIGVVPRRI